MSSVVGRKVAVIAAEGVVLAPSRGNAPQVSSLVRRVFDGSLASCGVLKREVEGFVGIPALCELRFLEGHYQATKLGLFEEGSPVTRTVDSCGASPVTGLLEAVRMVQYEDLEVVAVAAGDVVGSLSSEDFLKKAETVSGDRNELKSPAIVLGYDRVARYHEKKFERDHYRMAAALESYHASKHPESLFAQLKKRPYTLEDLRQAPAVTEMISVKECAWRADGAGCVLLASEKFVNRRNIKALAWVRGGAEASGPLYPKEPEFIKPIHLEGTRRAADAAYARSGLSPQNINFFGLYDCFPVCLLRAIEAAGIADDAGKYVEEQFQRLQNASPSKESLHADPTFFPINTHGGLLCYGAPFAVPAFYNIVEATRQLTNTARGRQIPHCEHALVYGNGGVFSSSAVAILSSNSSHH